MPDHRTKLDQVSVADVHIRSQPDRQQFADPLGSADTMGILPAFIARNPAEVGEVLSVDPNRANRMTFRRRTAEWDFELT
jgi:hypothetical protein